MEGHFFNHVVVIDPEDLHKHQCFHFADSESLNQNSLLSSRKKGL